ncbi:MAG: hypothetical protein JWO09_3912 [Bacteroidetes bacterium]|nr:hypothetical protein [Bacteroidota bacterium]
MKKLSGILIFGLLALCSCIDIPEHDSYANPANKASAITTDIITKVACDSTLPVTGLEQRIKRWLDFYSRDSKDFRLEDFKFASCSQEKGFLTVENAIDKEYMDLYGSLFIYSPDSTQFLDLDSYNLLLEKDKKGKLVGTGGDPETEVALLDVRTHTRKRLLFYGPSVIIEDAAWLSGKKITIAYLSETAINDVYHHNLLIIDLSDNTFTQFENPSPLKAEAIHNYLFSERWRSVKIKD